MTGDYSEHTVALEAILNELKQGLRDKKWAEAEEAAKKAMTRLARIHGYINFHRQERS